MKNLYFFITERVLLYAAALLTLLSVVLAVMRLTNTLSILSSLILLTLAGSVIMWILYALHRAHLIGLFDSIQYAAFSLLLLISMFSYYNPFLVQEIWVLFALYLLVISLYQNQKLLLIWSGICSLFYGIIVYRELMMNKNILMTEQLILLALNRTAFILGGMLLAFLAFSYTKKLKVSLQEQQFKKERKQLYRMVHALVPAVERKTQTSREEIESMHLLMKSMLRSLQNDQVEDWELHMIALLHYVSRIKWPDYFFDKEGKLTDFEYQMVKEHCFFAKEFLPDDPAYRRVIDALSYHHERVDGTGYPYCYTGDKIPILAQVLGIAECYIAMVSPRSYRGMMEGKDALAEICMTQGEMFAPQVIEALAVSSVVDSPLLGKGQSSSKVGMHRLKSGS